MYSFSDAEQRAAKATMVSFMDQGYRWHEAASRAGVSVSRATAYRLWLRSWREGPSYLDDGRHGHPSKLRDHIRHWLLDTCTHAPSTPSPRLQAMLAHEFAISVSVRHINRVRTALGVPSLRSPFPKKR